MPSVDLSRMLHAMLKAREAASRMELRFLRQLAGTVLTASRNGRRATATAPAYSRRRILKCPRCSRRFARPVHLGRHLSATHGVKKRKTAA